VARYSERVWAEVDPATADRLREADAEVVRREDAVLALKHQVEDELKHQEDLLKNFRGRSLLNGSLLTGHAPQQLPPPLLHHPQRRGVRPTSASLYGADPRDRRG
jgi:hypothetical protein